MVSESFKNVTRILTEKQMTPIIGTLNKQLLDGLVLIWYTKIIFCGKISFMEFLSHCTFTV